MRGHLVTILFSLTASLGDSQPLRSSEMQQMYKDRCVATDEDEKDPIIHNHCICGLLETLEPAVRGIESISSASTSCSDGLVTTAQGNYACHNVELLSFVSLSELNSVYGSTDDVANDIWGWTADTGEEIAIIGLVSGTAFVDVTDPINYRYLGKLPTRTGDSFWRDIKTYGNFAFVVSESEDHGLQVVDMTQMVNLDLSNGPVVFGEAATLESFGNAHNIFINEESGYAYVVGSQLCKGGLLIFDVSNTPAIPEPSCFSADGYTHDVQCVVYNGNDTKYQGREMCFACNEDTVTIVDVTDKNNPMQISRTGYPDSVYTHQGWLADDHNTFLFGDESDEISHGFRARTMAMDVKDLENPRFLGNHYSDVASTDHNQYVLGDFTYQANYHAGLSVLKIMETDTNLELREYAYFDVRPEDDARGFNGAWSVFPYFPSGTIIVSSVERGLFVLKASLQGPAPPRTRYCSGNPGCSSVHKSGAILYTRKFFGACHSKCISNNMIWLHDHLGWNCGECP